MPTDSSSIYNVGRELRVTSHRPPGAFDYDIYQEKQRESCRGSPTPSDTPTAFVLRIPLLRTEDVPDPRTNVLTLEKRLSNKEEGSQVWTCRLGSKIDGCDRVVAKIYDPLYYPWVRNEITQQHYHVVFEAERDYSREAAAYEHAQRLHYDGQLTPRYYGSWTCEIGPGPRSVHLILIECIDGRPLYEAYYNTYARRPHILSNLLPPSRNPDLPDSLRLDILGKAMIIKAKQMDSGLYHNDFAPRNVIAILDGTNSSGSIKHQVRRVVLIDYNISKLPGAARRASRNPLSSLWNGAIMPEWEDWLPATWKEDTVARRKWLYRTFGPSDVRRLYREMEPTELNTIKSWVEAHK